MITISLCMIVKNEEAVLARCLDSVREVADEIVVVDTGSADATREIARRYTDKVYDFPWVDDFAAARNESFSHATMDYILWLDADDLIDGENREKLLRLKADFPAEVDVAMLKYNVAFDADGNCTFSYYRERLVRREKGYRWMEPVHEHIVIHGVTREFDIAVIHGHKERSGGNTRNLDIYRGLEEKGAPLSTRALYYYARELKTHGRTEEAADRYRRFFARGDGWMEDQITASGDLAECLLALGKREEALETLAKSFTRDLPRAEILCKLGRIYMQDGDYRRAAYWYGLALEAPKPAGWGFLSEDYWGFIPHMQLCVLCDRTGDREGALRHHEAAKSIKPSDQGVAHNERYFYGEAL